ncbi:MAG: pyridoxal-phosphate dependent enzyme [Aeromicrobium sp.]
MTRWYAHARNREWRCAAPSEEVLSFHQGLAGYAPTPLIDLPDIAASLGIGRLLAKSESSRLGLPAFKALGASWAVHQVASAHPPGTRLTFVTATDGNHGRAVARYARLLGHAAEIICPRGVSAGALAAIVDEGAVVVTLDATYDDAVAEAARRGQADGYELVQDTSWEGYEDIPRLIVEGYGTMLRELNEQVAGVGAGEIALVLVPTGVGSLLQAVLANFRDGDRPASTAVVAVEPDVAACMPPSLAAGHPVTVDTGVTSMAGLNCGTPSGIAWPYILNGLDGVAVVTDADAAAATVELDESGVAAGPCGAAALAGLRVVLADGAGDVSIGRHSTVVLLITEGPRED